MDSQQCVLSLRVLYILVICFAFNKSQAVSTVRGFPHKYVDKVRIQGVQPQPIRRQTRVKAFFAPDDNLQKIIIDLINKEQKKIQIAIYLFTDPAIAQALQTAYANGVCIEIITDQDCLDAQGSALEQVKKDGIPLYVYPSFMHDKFVIFGKNRANRALVWTGSYNFTRCAGQVNQENAVLIDDAGLVKKYKDQFEFLKERSSKVGNQTIQQIKKKSNARRTGKRRSKKMLRRRSVKKKRKQRP